MSGVLISKKELLNAFGMKSYQGLYALLNRFGIELEPGKQLLTPNEVQLIEDKTGVTIKQHKK